MNVSFHHRASKLLSICLAASVALTAGPAALRAIAQIDALLAHISLELCEMGLAFLRTCGI